MAGARRHSKLSSAQTSPHLGRGYLQLREFVRELAALLLPRGVTPKLIGDLVRIAFVQAAADRSKLMNGRVNYSRVAAQTGLSRADVKRLLRPDISNSPLAMFAEAPVEKVIRGWCLDRDFVTTDRLPKPLRLDGKAASFKALAKRYGGDIPPRAILEELKSAQAVTIQHGFVRLTLSRQFRKRGDLAFLEPAMEALLDGLRTVSADRRRKTPTPSIQRILLPAETEVDLTIIRDRCASSARSMLEGLGHSLCARLTRPRKKVGAAYSFTVTVMLTERRLRQAPAKDSRA